jgi:hypothetical protein
MAEQSDQLPVLGWLRLGWRADTGDSRPTTPMRISRSAEYSVPVAHHAAATSLITALQARVAELEAAQTIPTIEPNSQNWATLDGAVAWHLIERHADNWADVGRMMDEWLAAKTSARVAELESEMAEKLAISDKVCRDWAWHAVEATGRAEAAEAQLEEARKDAQRYRWLRSVPNGFKAQRIVNDTPEGMDAAIDSAIKAGGGGK